MRTPTGKLIEKSEISDSEIFSQRFLKRAILILIPALAVTLSLFFGQEYHFKRIKAIQKKYSSIPSEYLESFRNQINYHEDRIGILEKSQTESREVISAIKDIAAGQETTF